MDKYNQIISIGNIRNAYFDLVEKFDLKGYSIKYTGIDGLALKDIDANSEDVFEEIRDELISLKEIRHVVQYKIPKKNSNGIRDIFIYTIKERIKAQAIYRVVEPVFEEAYSPFLFSYRSSQPSYFAARSVVRRYKRRYAEDNVLIVDFSSYSDFIEYKVLTEIIEKLGFSKKVMQLLKLFINVKVFDDSGLETEKQYGLMQGVPLIALFANIYLNDLDKYIGKKAQFYRRVGDDLIICDPNKEKLEEIYSEVLKATEENNLIIKKEKTKLINSSQEFNFLGYTFKENTVRIKDTGIKRIVSRWKTKLRYSHLKEQRKIRILRELLYGEGVNMQIEFKQIVKQYMFVDEQAQFKKLYSTFIKLLVKFFYGKYSERNHRLTLKLIENVNIPSLYKNYIDLHNGKKI